MCVRARANDNHKQIRGKDIKKKKKIKKIKNIKDYIFFKKKVKKVNNICTLIFHICLHKDKNTCQSF